MKALIFDLDGTLIDSLDAHRQIMKDVASRHGITITEEDFAHFNGMSNKEGLLWLVWNKKKMVNPFTLLKEKNALKEKIYEGISLFPDTLSTLDRLNTYTKALATSSQEYYMNRNIQHFKLAKYFDAVVSASEVKKSKPRPDIFLSTAKKLRREPSECVVIEDAPQGVIAAHKAGMKCIALLTTTKKKYFTGEGVPEKFIHSLTELTPQLIESLDKK